MGFCNCCFVRFQNDLCTFRIHMKSPQDQNQTRKRLKIQIQANNPKNKPTLLTVYDEIVFNQSSYKLNSTICGSVAFKIKSPNFSTLRQAWKGSCSSEPLITMLGKSRRWTSSGSNIPFLVTMICFGCSSTGNERINAATSSAVFHFANYKAKTLRH